MTKIKLFLLTLVLAVASTALANSFTVSVGAAEVALVPAPAGSLFAAGEYGVNITDDVSWVAGAVADLNGWGVLTGFTFNLPTNEAADADLFFAARIGLGASWSFTDFYPQGAATLGLRGDNGIVIEGGVRVVSDFSVSSFAFSPVVTLGYGFQF